MNNYHGYSETFPNGSDWLTHDISDRESEVFYETLLWCSISCTGGWSFFRTTILFELESDMDNFQVTLQLGLLDDIAQQRIEGTLYEQ